MSALENMVSRLDSTDANGYVTNAKELQAILAELSPLVSVAILKDESYYNNKEVGIKN